MRVLLVVLLHALAVGTTACGSESEPAPNSGIHPAAAAVCDHWSRIARARGCEAPTGTCQADPACATEYEAWLDCVETDVTQCLCESGGDLNCEGSFKPNEGPAKCITEFEAVSACEG